MTDPATPAALPALLDTATGEVMPGAFSPTSLALPDGLDYGDWARYGRTISQVANASLWWLGDWWRYGQARYGGTRPYGDGRAAADDASVDYGSAMNAGRVSGAFEFSRRRENLTWSHHVEVAPLDPDEADALLGDAADGGWSVRDLRTEVKAIKQRKKTLELLSSMPRPSAEDADPIRLIDCLELIASLPDASVSLLCTDPPYAVTENDWDTWGSEDDYWKFMAGCAA